MITCPPFIQSRRAMTLLEIMGMLFIVSVGLLTVWQITYSGQKLVNNTENRIKAINLAREGIEAVTNIRDTNWVRFYKKKYCWNVQDYNQKNSGDATCVGDDIPSPDVAILSGTYIPYLSGSVWYVTNEGTNTGIYMNGSGFPFQTGSIIPSYPRCTVNTVTWCVTQFFRTVTISPMSPDPLDSFASGMTVRSTVTWRDNQTHTVTLDTTLTNWRSNF